MPRGRKPIIRDQKNKFIETFNFVPKQKDILNSKRTLWDRFTCFSCASFTQGKYNTYKKCTLTNLKTTNTGHCDKYRRADFFNTGMV